MQTGFLAELSCRLQAVREAAALLQKRKEHLEEKEADWKDAETDVKHVEARLRSIPKPGGAFLSALWQA